MEPVEGAATFQKSGADYDFFMGRYSHALAAAFADWAGVKGGGSALDVGCGPGALTGVLAERLGPAAVLACEPSVRFVEECRARHPGVTVSRGHAEELPYQDASQDTVLAQLVLHRIDLGGGLALLVLRRTVVRFPWPGSGPPGAMPCASRRTSRKRCAKPCSARLGHPPGRSSSGPWLGSGAESLPRLTRARSDQVRSADVTPA